MLLNDVSIDKNKLNAVTNKNTVPTAPTALPLARANNSSMTVVTSLTLSASSVLNNHFCTVSAISPLVTNARKTANDTAITGTTDKIVVNDNDAAI